MATPSLKPVATNQWFLDPAEFCGRTGRQLMCGKCGIVAAVAAAAVSRSQGGASIGTALVEGNRLALLLPLRWKIRAGCAVAKAGNFLATLYRLPAKGYRPNIDEKGGG
jgi:hypothetical protein